MGCHIPAVICERAGVVKNRTIVRIDGEGREG